MYRLIFFAKVQPFRHSSLNNFAKYCANPIVAQ